MVLKKIGACWRKEKEDGVKFFSGEIEIEGKKYPILLYPFTNKTKKDGAVIKNPPAYSFYLVENEGKPTAKTTSGYKKSIIED